MGPADRRAARAAIDDFLRALGHDPATEPELSRTGERVADAYIDDLCDGYAVDVEALLRKDAIGGKSEVVALHGIAVATVCPHHLMVAGGTARVAFAPAERLVGLGTIVKVVDAFAHRLTLQEDIGQRVCEALVAHLSARWAACGLVLSHSCVSAQGPRRHGTHAETLAFVGDEASRSLALGIVRAGA